MMGMGDTIAAIATGMTEGGIGIVRISGTDALNVADHVAIIGKNGKLSSFPPRTVHLAKVFSEGQFVDNAIVFYMKAPQSYTGEDTVEIQGHGGIRVMHCILDAALKAGAVAAKPGEFTKRAFLNGKMDLSEAEAVMGLVMAQNNFALRASADQLSGRIAECVREMRSKILNEVAFLEAAMDDPEQISAEGHENKLVRALSDISRRLGEIIARADDARILSGGIRTIILGRPNAGKSSVLNLLSGTQRAIVTNIAGTTRDTVEESVRIGDLGLRLVDTAGIRETTDVLERLGVDRALGQIQTADLILYVIDGTRPPEDADRELLQRLDDEGRRVIILLNKSDLEVREDVKIAFGADFSNIPKIVFSAMDGDGRKDLENAIYEMFKYTKGSGDGEVIVTSLRHKESMERALESLEKAVAAIEEHVPEDLYTIDMMDAYNHLGEVIGEETGEDLIEEIFGKFCMGK